MGMSIEEAIKWIDEHNYIHQSKEPRAVYITEAFDTLIKVAKKYQKIQKIYERFQKDGYYDSYMAWLDTREVIEDDNT